MDVSRNVYEKFINASNTTFYRCKDTRGIKLRRVREINRKLGVGHACRISNLMR